MKKIIALIGCFIILGALSLFGQVNSAEHNPKGLEEYVYIEGSSYKGERFGGYYLSKYEVTWEEAAEVFNWAIARDKIYVKEVVDLWGGKNDFIHAPLLGKIVCIDGEVDWYESYLDFENGRFLPKKGYEKHPMCYLSWYGAIKFCNMKSQMEGLKAAYRFEDGEFRRIPGSTGYRLPTETEWEYAATSGGKKYTYTWGNGLTPNENLSDKSLYDKYPPGMWRAWPGYDDGYVFTAPVGVFPPNELGLFDIGGNVGEWCWGYDPELPSYKSLRGAAYDCEQILSRIESKNYYEPNFTLTGGGIRLVRSSW